MKHVRIYTTPSCPYCLYAKALLRQRGIPFEEIGVLGDTAKRAWLLRVTGRRTVPQIFLSGLPIGGYDDLARLDRSGELDRLLSEGSSVDTEA